jgi:hypothetical protein
MYSGEGILFLQRASSGIEASRSTASRGALFAPLGLARTSFVWTEALEPDLASGHRDDGSFKERTRYLRPMPRIPSTRRRRSTPPDADAGAPGVVAR